MKVCCEFLIPLVVLVAGCAIEQPVDESPAALAAREWEAYTRRPRERPPAKRSGNITIIVDKIIHTDAQSLDFDLLWRYADESIAIGTPGGELARSNGIRIGVAKDGFQAVLKAAQRNARSRQSEQLWLTVLSGTQGHILVAQSTHIGVLRHRTAMGESIILANAMVGASMVIEPRILAGDDIQVKLHPRFSSRDGKTINLTDLTTELVLRHGQPLVMAGLDQASDSAGFALFSYGKAETKSRMTLVITPYIEESNED